MRKIRTRLMKKPNQITTPKHFPFNYPLFIASVFRLPCGRTRIRPLRVPQGIQRNKIVSANLNRILA